ncbi:MAG: hypothetical protein OXE92_11055 [Bacteroidetes bacterium]|nr:hypothetical protein [Bacteroidota bacterium]
MKKLFNFICICVIFILGSLVSAHVSDSATKLECDNGTCKTELNTDDDGWEMSIDCGEYGSWSGSGDGPWIGRLCGVSVNGG